MIIEKHKHINLLFHLNLICLIKFYHILISEADPLITSKQLNYLDFKKAVELIYYAETNININEIIFLKSKMNKARSIEDKFNFCNNSNIILESNWVQGFIDGEGSFQCDLQYRTTKTNSYYLINTSLQIKQNNHEVAVLDAIKSFFQNQYGATGFLKPAYNTKDLNTILNLNRNATTYWITQSNIIIDFIESYPLYTRKILDYLDWKQIVNLKSNKAHLTAEGIDLIKKIKSGMNSGRI